MEPTDTDLSTAIKVRLPAPMHAQLTALSSTGVLNLSDHVRIALQNYLTLTSIPPSNGFVDSDKNR